MSNQISTMVNIVKECLSKLDSMEVGTKFKFTDLCYNLKEWKELPRHLKSRAGILFGKEVVDRSDIKIIEKEYLTQRRSFMKIASSNMQDTKLCTHIDIDNTITLYKELKSGVIKCKKCDQIITVEEYKRLLGPDIIKTKEVKPKPCCTHYDKYAGRFTFTSLRINPPREEEKTFHCVVCNEEFDSILEEQNRLKEIPYVDLSSPFLSIVIIDDRVYYSEKDALYCLHFKSDGSSMVKNGVCSHCKTKL